MLKFENSKPNFLLILHVDKMAAILTEDIFKCVLFNENSEF